MELMHVDTPQSACRAGVSRRDITPPVGIYHRMWGAATHDRSTGVHRPLLCTALALAPRQASASAQTVQVIVTIDHCLFWTEQLDAITKTVCEAASLTPQQLHLACSHTHAAGLMDPSRGDLPGGELIAPYLAEMTKRIAQAVHEAIAALAPAEIVYGRGRCSLAAQRDFWDESSQQFVCGYNPAGDADDTLIVARITGPQKQTLATVVNYACHPTTLAWDNTLISPDYVGAMREVVEAATGGAPCLFLQGASGDLGPRRGFVGDVATADRNGQELGYAALSTLIALPAAGTCLEYAGPVISGATIGTWRDRPLSADEAAPKADWHAETLSIPLPYRPDLPTRELSEEELARWMREEHKALEQGDAAKARDCRAQVERMSRQLARLRMLPEGDSVGARAAILSIGDAVWVLVAGEHYQILQRVLRERFAGRAVLVATVTSGWLPGYLPTADCYGRGIYQETIAIVAAGSLETLIERLTVAIENLG
jgi:hypothetical protein